MRLLTWPNSIVVATFLTGAASASQTTRDSAGVQIITFDERRPTGNIVVSASPVIDIGTSDDARAQLHQVGDIRILRDGTLLVANRGTTELKFFAPNGRYVRTAARKGTGPGEFQALAALWVTSADSIIAADGLLRRIVLFDRDGRHVRTFAIETPVNRRTPRPLDYMAPDVLLAGSSDVTALPARPEAYYFRQVVYALDLTGRVRSTIGSFGEGEHFVQVMDPAHPERGNSYWNRAFGRQTTVRSLGDLVAAGDGETPEIRLYSPRGNLKRVLRGRQQPPSVRQADIDAFKARTLESAARSPMKAMVERMLQEMPFPDRMPAFERFEAGPLGQLWLKRYQRPTDSTETWAVLSMDGRYYGEVELPPGARLRTVTERHLLCVWHDSDDVEHVRTYSYQLVRGAKP